MTETSAQRDEYRLTESDETTMRQAIAASVKVAVEQSVTGKPNLDREVLRRIGAHAIGCSLFDLRGSELHMLDLMVAAAVERAAVAS